LNVRFIAVTCHYDILDWLEPDWVLDTATGKCSKVFLRRPSIDLEIVKCHYTDWKYFSKYHYLNTAKLPSSSQCYAALWNGNPVAFCSIINNFSRYQGYRRISRLVTLPDYQGIGIGKKLLNFVADKYKREGFRVTIGTVHPGMVQGLRHSAEWRFRETNESLDKGRKTRVVLGRRIAFFEYRG
jgi:GNAT superfamily N-acetyltransferase